jgi:hypothetical protein
MTQRTSRPNPDKDPAFFGKCCLPGPRWFVEASDMDAFPSASPTPYMLFFRNSGPETYHRLSPEDRQQLVVRWNEWFEGLLAEGKAIEGQPLEPDQRLVSGPGGSRITDGPFAEAKEAIGGYVTLMVTGMEEATAIAQRHPGLAHGLVIEVRKLTPDCHLGVTTRGRAGAGRAAS